MKVQPLTLMGVVDGGGDDDNDDNDKWNKLSFEFQQQMYFDFLPGSGNKNLLFQHMRHNSKF
jgi:hypothetical protein